MRKKITLNATTKKATAKITATILTATLAIGMLAGCGNSDDEKETTKKKTNNVTKTEEAETTTEEETTTYSMEIETDKDGNLTVIVTGEGTTIDLTDAETETDKEKTVYTTADGRKVTVNKTGRIEVETTTEEPTPEQTTEAPTTTTQPVTEAPTPAPTTTQAPTQAPTPAPTQAPTPAPTTTQKVVETQPATEEPTTVPADYSPTAKYDYYDPEVQRLLAFGYAYPTVDYSTLPVQDFSKYFTKEALGEKCRSVEINEWGSYVIETVDNATLTLSPEVPLYTLVNWNGKIGYFVDGLRDAANDLELKQSLVTTDFAYNDFGNLEYITFGNNLTWGLVNSIGNQCYYTFVYLN